MIGKIYKVAINFIPSLRGALKSVFCIFRRNVSILKGTRIKKGVEWKLFPGCHFEGGRGLIVGKDVTINVSKGASLVLRDRVGIGNRCQIVSHEAITIGEGTVLAPGVMIYDHNHVFDFEDGVRQREFSTAPVSIGKHCWLGAGVIVLKGVRIGDNCVIGAGAVVTKDIPSCSVAVGNPARVIKKK